jgi:hypothetical protein
VIDRHQPGYAESDADDCEKGTKWPALNVAERLDQEGDHRYGIISGCGLRQLADYSKPEGILRDATVRLREQFAEADHDDASGTAPCIVGKRGCALPAVGAGAKSKRDSFGDRYPACAISTCTYAIMVCGAATMTIGGNEDQRRYRRCSE